VAPQQKGHHHEQNRQEDLYHPQHSLIVAIVVITALTACGQDAQVGQRDRGTADVLNMPQGWSNVAMKCDGHGHRVFATDHGDSYSSSLAVVADTSCGDKTTTP
jgi:hypothetical protein